MTEQHPITPPPELVEQWREKWHAGLGPFAVYIATCAAKWGADVELEKCCEWLKLEGHEHEHAELREARRPKPQTLNSIALQMLSTIERDAPYLSEITDTIRKALEQHND